MMPHIIEKCEENRARAYIKMNCLDAESVMLGQIAELIRVIRESKWYEIASTLNSACGQSKKQNGNEKLYLIDIDDTYKEAWLQWRLLFLTGAGDWNIHYYMSENDLNKALTYDKNKIVSSEYIVSLIILNRCDFINTYNTPENIKTILDSLNGNEFVGIQLIK